jgi:hypothetical protein
MRTKIVKVRLSEDEHRRLKALARKGGVSAHLRNSALRNDYRKELSVVAALTRARNLLVQIAQNSARRPAIEQVLIVSQLVTVERALTKFAI